MEQIKTSKLPQVSIVMPVFNHAELVIEMMESVCRNTLTDWELLAVDDGSDEADFAQIAAFAAGDERICYVRRERGPKGAQTCRNIGLGMARGEYVAFFDSDDWITPTCLMERVRAIGQHPELDFMVFPAGIYRDGEIHVEPGCSMYGYPIYGDDVAAFCSRNLPFVVWNNLYRRSSLLANGLRWDERLLSLQDAAFNLAALTSGLKYAYATDVAPDYAYRLASVGSISKQIGGAVHFRSNALATEIAYHLVQQRFGHRYDSALYRGALYVYVKVARVGYDAQFVNEMACVIGRYSPIYGRWFRLQMWLTRRLMQILPYKMARQLPLAINLTHRWILEEFWIPRRQRKWMKSL